MGKYKYDIVSYTREICCQLIDGKTIRQIASILGCSKSLVHYYIHKHMLDICGTSNYYKALDQLEFNLKHRHIVGGEATRKRWKEIKAHGTIRS